MQPQADLALKRTTSPRTYSLRTILIDTLALGFVACLYLLLPLLPLLASILYQRRKYAVQYWRTLKKMVTHLRALSEGPVRHYLEDVVGRHAGIPADIRGECTQCGNCCLDKRCVFLEPAGEAKYLCGIYHSPLRRFSNCGSFPLSAHDIERYACPGYSVIQEVPIIWMHRQPAAAPCSASAERTDPA